ncbi:unnamed protein product [Vicia faba]|uniref:RING-type E3 ubiquitin transferase n=1 Tax=Vicia faba TaxID=3906 RepID=A0AAV1B763_VICFA|nr:unnamed protein product [Vicia faba]
MEIANEPPPSLDGSPTAANTLANSPSASSTSSSSSSPRGSKGKEIEATTSTAPPPARYDDDDEDEEDVCRICRNPGETDNPLRYPCACSGSIKFVHQDCLLQWLNHSNARQCEVCKHPFSFSPVYAENAPARLPFQEFVVGMGMKACHVLQFFVRLSFVLSVWLLIIPFITFWIWRLAFVRSFGEAQRLFLSHLSTAVILTDCLHGFLLSASIVFIFLGATSLRDYFRHLREIGGQDADRDDEVDRNGARVARRPPGQANRNVNGDANGEDAGGAQGVAGAGQVIRRNAENVAARWEMQAARLEAHVEQMFDGLDDADGAEDVPFDELVGMQGPVFHLVENAFTVLASNMIFLGVVIFVPFSLGRIILHYLSWFFSTAVKNVSSDTQESGSIGQIAEMLKVNASELSEMSNNISASVSADILKGGSVGTSRISDVTTLAIGYIFILTLIFCYFGIVALIRYTKGEPLTAGRFYGIASIAETIPSLFRQFLAAMRHLMTMMFGKTMAHRAQFFAASPLASSLMHWVVGIVYMLQISIFVSLLRGVLRNGVLYFLRDPADPNYNPFRDLIDDPVHKHARRVLLSVAVYGSLIVMLVFLPVKLSMRMAPFIFPLEISLSDPFTEIPANMLLFQICIPFAVEHFKLRTTIKSLLRYWFTAVGWALGLTDFLLPRPDDDGNQENGNGERGRQERLQIVQAGIHDQGMMPFAGDDLNRVTNADAGEDYENDEQSDSDYAFVLRIVLLLVIAWMTLLVFNSSLVVVPISLGRVLFNSIPRLPITHGIKCNDLYAFIIGSYVIWTAVAGVRYSIEQVRKRRTSVLLNQIWKWCSIVMKSSALLSIWIFVIPVLIGLLFELLVIVPMRVPVDESPVFLLYQDWALGLIFLKIWTRLVMLDHMMPLMDESWRVKFERRYVSSTRRFHVWFTNLHNSIRDDRYLIGRRLHNFGEHVEKANEAEDSTVVQDTILLGTNVNQQDQDADVGLRLRHINQQAG